MQVLCQVDIASVMLSAAAQKRARLNDDRPEPDQFDCSKEMSWLMQTTNWKSEVSQGTEPYDLLQESSLNSFSSEHTQALHCEEVLPVAERGSATGAGHPSAAVAIKPVGIISLPTKDCSPSSPLPSLPLVSPRTAQAGEAILMIRNEARKQDELLPCFAKLAVATLRSSNLASEWRLVVKWLMEVVRDFELQQETLFLAVSYMARFLGSSQGLPSGFNLQLVAVACLSLACKNEEVEQPRIVHWQAAAANCFESQDLIQMEWLVADNLLWRLRTPTPYSFLHLYCYGLASCPEPTICLASYIVELALMEIDLMQLSQSMLAASAIIMAHAATGAAFNIQALLTLAPHLDLQQVEHTCSALVRLHAEACSPSIAAAACALTTWLNIQKDPSVHGVGEGLGPVAMQVVVGEEEQGIGRESQSGEVAGVEEGMAAKPGCVPPLAVLHAKYSGQEWKEAALYRPINMQMVRALV